MEKEPLTKKTLREFLDKKPKYPTTLNLRSCKYRITDDEFCSYIPDVIKTLNLSHNELTEVVNLSGLTRIKELYLEHNQISEMSFEGLENCVTLSLAHNKLEFLNDMSSLKKLTTLNLSSNFLLAGFHQLAKLKLLKALDLSCNNINFRKATFVKNIALPLKSLPKLVSLDLTANPCVDAITDFRLVVLFHLPALKTINGVVVSKKDRGRAKKPGPHQVSADEASITEKESSPPRAKNEKKLRRLSTHFRRAKTVEKNAVSSSAKQNRRKSMVMSSPRSVSKSQSNEQLASHLDVGGSTPPGSHAGNGKAMRAAHLDVGGSTTTPVKRASHLDVGGSNTSSRAPHLDVGGSSSGGSRQVKRAPHLDVGGSSSDGTVAGAPHHDATGPAGVKAKRASHLDVGNSERAKRAPHLDVGGSVAVSGGGEKVNRAPHLDVGGPSNRAPHLDVGGGAKRSPHLDVGGGAKRAPHLDVGGGANRAPHLDVGGGAKRAPHLDVGGGSKSGKPKRAAHLDVGGSSPKLPTTPEEIENYKEMMRKKYEEQQRQAASSIVGKSRSVTVSLSSTSPPGSGTGSSTKSLSAMRTVDMKELIAQAKDAYHEPSASLSPPPNHTLESLIKKREVKGADLLLKDLIDIIGSFCLAVSPEDCRFDDVQMEEIKASLRQLVSVIRTMFPRVREYSARFDPHVSGEIVRAAQGLQQQMKQVIIAVKGLSEDKGPVMISAVVVASQALVESSYELFLACEIDGVPSCDNITDEIRQCASFTTQIIRMATGAGSSVAEVSRTCDAAVLRTEKMLHKVNIKAPEIQHLPSQKNLLEVTSRIDDYTNELVKTAKSFATTRDRNLVRKMTDVARALADDFKTAINLLASTKKIVPLSSADEVALYESATSTLENALDAFANASSQISMSSEEELVGKHLRRLTTSIADLRRRLASGDASAFSVKNRYLQVTEATEISLDLLECVEPSGKKCTDPQLAEQLALYGRGIRYYSHLLKLAFAVQALGLRKDNIQHIATAINGISSCVVLMTNIYSLVLIMG